MRPALKKLTQLSILLFIILSASLAPASDKSPCQEEEKRLRTVEADQCSGMSYIFNPSACFNTRKLLAPYNKGKCRSIAVNEGGVVLTAEPVKAGTVDIPLQQPTVTYVATESPEQPHLSQVAMAAPPAESTEIELLKREVVLLKKELAELKAEMLRLNEKVSRQRLH